MAVHCLFILTGCYDSLGRIWKQAEWCTHMLEGHSGAISSVRIINLEGRGRLYTCGPYTVRLLCGLALA
ncbi:hypothetical protein GOBAR_AA09644 [Gossypium barbadense]|uniref:Uncharacterized protein n=1 Tax=Gossypium barbadense TaxID=3634 RepID=A0A2P5Y5Y6_GOSBA|nr:hypothetical protein GOBAR_AA09644 [Gossypium barbadense]